MATQKRQGINWLAVIIIAGWIVAIALFMVLADPSDPTTNQVGPYCYSAGDC